MCFWFWRESFPRKPRFWWHRCQGHKKFDKKQSDTGPPYQFVNEKEKCNAGVKTKFEGDPLHLVGKKCGKCDYEVTLDTRLLNKKGFAVQRVDGTDTGEKRDELWDMRCCRCKSENWLSHSAHEMDDIALGSKPHNCPHAKEYREKWGTVELKGRLKGCSCINLNRYNENIGDWSPAEEFLKNKPRAPERRGIGSAPELAPEQC